MDHLGIQTDTEEELAELRARAQAAGVALRDEGETTCCYARSDKYWVTDPQGMAWEQFHTLDNIPVFSEAAPKADDAGAVCCTGSVPRHRAGKGMDMPVGAAPSSCC